jgi:hypothetical protein
MRESNQQSNALETLPASKRSPARTRLTLAVGLIWFMLAATAIAWLTSYENTPGPGGSALDRWPRDTQIPHAVRGPTLVLFLHPRCPCSRATVAELERILTRSGDKLEASVVFYQPPNADAAWTESDLCTSASALPHVRVVPDVDGVEARRFHVKTSGHALLYDNLGRLQFSGGITAARAHHGDNPGETTILALVRGEPVTRNETPVFGCPIRADYDTENPAP